MKKLALVAFFVLFSQTLEASENELVGVWDTHTYVVEGKNHALDGIIIFTENYFAGTAYSSFSGGEMDDSNANAGTYTIDGNKVTFQQQVQIHIRPGDKKEPIFYGKDVPGRSNLRGRRRQSDYLLPVGFQVPRQTPRVVRPAGVKILGCSEPSGQTPI